MTTWTNHRCIYWHQFSLVMHPLDSVVTGYAFLISSKIRLKSNESCKRNGAHSAQSFIERKLILFWVEESYSFNCMHPFFIVRTLTLAYLGVWRLQSRFMEAKPLSFDINEIKSIGFHSRSAHWERMEIHAAFTRPLHPGKSVCLS